MELETIFRPSLVALGDYAPSWTPPHPGEVYAHLNEAPEDLPAPLKEAILDRLRALPFHRYPDPHARELTARIAAREGMPPECVLPVGGANDAVAKILFAMHPESTLVQCPPTYPLYDRMARLMGLAVVDVPLDERLGVKGGEVLVAGYAAHRCVVILSHPGNPSGQLVDEEALALVLGQFPGLVVVDEAYHDFSGATVADQIAENPGLVVLRTFSKAFSFAAGRAGYLLADPQVVRQLRKAVVPYSLPATTQAIACALLDHAELARERARAIAVTRDRLLERLALTPRLRPVPSVTNFLLVRMDPAGAGPAALVAEAGRRGVHLRDLSAQPRLADAFRVTIGRADECDRVAAVLEELAASSR